MTLQAVRTITDADGDRWAAKKGYITQPDHTNARSVRVLKLPDGTPVHGWAPITTTEDHQ
jgi:hypothetical protein